VKVAPKQTHVPGTRPVSHYQLTHTLNRNQNYITTNMIILVKNVKLVLGHHFTVKTKTRISETPKSQVLREGETREAPREEGPREEGIGEEGSREEGPR
jgi:hypothetical protein